MKANLPISVKNLIADIYVFQPDIASMVETACENSYLNGRLDERREQTMEIAKIFNDTIPDEAKDSSMHFETEIL